MSTDDLLFIDTPDLERRVRSRDPESSWAVAAITPGAAKSVCDFILAALTAAGPLTDDELYARYHAAGGRRTAQRVRTAREELVHPKEGKPQIRQAAAIGVSAAGNAARRWERAI